jgi:hypothetical protein
MPQSAIYRVLIDEDWKLDDLYNVPYTYAQAYNFIFWFDCSDKVVDAERIEAPFKKYVLEGGYSYVHVYSLLRCGLYSTGPLGASMEFEATLDRRERNHWKSSVCAESPVNHRFREVSGSRSKSPKRSPIWLSKQSLEMHSRKGRCEVGF